MTSQAPPRMAHKAGSTMALRRRAEGPVADLGALGDGVLVFGEPYGNLEATEALLARAARHAVPPERLICTGDTVAYCADPDATVALLREAGVAVVMGNCEEALGRGAEDCGCGFDQASECRRLSETWYAYCADRLDDEAKRWMGQLPRSLRFTMGGRRLSVVHGAVSRINRFVFASTPAQLKAREIASTGGDGIIAGHSGLPFTEIVGAKLWHNAGAIGLPANDGTPRAWYSLLRVSATGLAVEHHPFAYDHAAAAAKMRRRGLPEAYALSLGTGLWPKSDVLPAAESARRGRPLEPRTLTWAWEVPERAAS